MPPTNYQLASLISGLDLPTRHIKALLESGVTLKLGTRAGPWRSPTIFVGAYTVVDIPDIWQDLISYVLDNTLGKKET